MNTPSAVSVLSALAHEGRLDLFRLLVRRLPGRVTPAELVAASGSGPSLVSAHLGTLSRAGLVSRVRAGRSLRYRAEIHTLGSLATFLLEECCRGRVSRDTDDTRCCPPVASRSADRARDRLNVLFLDRSNAARSLIAEAVMRDRYPERCRAFSAGTAPARKAGKGVLETLRASGYDVSDLRPSSAKALRAPGTPTMDVVVTLSADVADGARKRWPGKPVMSHWEPPASIEGATGARALDGIRVDLERRLDAFVEAAERASGRRALQRAVDEAGGDAIGPERVS